MTGTVSEIEANTERSLEGFYSGYGWSLNPILKLSGIFDHLKGELRRYDLLPHVWEREESMTNIYLFVCAVSCAADDYVSWRPWVFRTFVDAYPKLSLPLRLIESILNGPRHISARSDNRKVLRWKEEWDRYVEMVCRMVMQEREITRSELTELIERFDEISSLPLPAQLLSWRMRLNEGFRCQDLTHHDAINLADRFIDSTGDRKSRVVVIGSRTAGSYFAPLIKVYLESKDFENVSWMTLRPKNGISGSEKKKLRNLLRNDARIILTDDYSNTGLTFGLLQTLLRKLGVDPSKITILAPIHPAKPEGNLSLSAETKVVTITHEQLHKTFLMKPENLKAMLLDILDESGVEGVDVIEDSSLDQINEEFFRHYADTFQARLKRLYRVRLKYRGGNHLTKKILVKSVGWGWLGYHAYLAGMRLRRLVPPVLGVRNGFMFSEWVEGTPLSLTEISGDMLGTMADYVAARTELLSLDEDPRLDYPAIGWGWLQALRILRKAYGARLGYLKNGQLLRQLRKSRPPKPVLTDGRMRPDEWLRTDKGLMKTDFEHHNFGAPEFDIVDPAYDLAIASFEFHLKPPEEERLVDSYRLESHDDTIQDRLLLYKLMYGAIEEDRTIYRLTHMRGNDDDESLNRRYLWSGNYRVYTMNCFSARLVRDIAARESDQKLFFMDLDGVFDTEVLGFAHTTTSALTALSILRSAGYIVIPNTGRSVEHIREYCRAYGFRCAIGEYGSVLYDASRGIETPLVGRKAAAELNRLRAIISETPGVFADASYRYAVRAYRYAGSGTVGLSSENAHAMLKQAGAFNLKCIVRQADTYFVDKDVDKGSAIERCKSMFHYVDLPAVSVGDSAEDVPMLIISDRAYAPRNCSPEIHRLEEEGKCVVVKSPRQRGLLAAVERETGRRATNEFPDRGKPDTIHRLITGLMTIAEGSRIRRLFDLGSGMSWASAKNGPGDTTL